MRSKSGGPPEPDRCCTAGEEITDSPAQRVEDGSRNGPADPSRALAMDGRARGDVSMLWTLVDGFAPPPMKKGRIRVLIADDHAVVRQGLRMFLATDPEIEMIGEAANGLEAVALARSLRPDVILMDLLMPELDGIAATAMIRRERPGTEVIILTGMADAAVVSGAVRAGAIGFLLKDLGAEQLCQAIRGAAAGQIQLAPEATSRLMREMRSLSGPEILTERELEILRLIAQGLSNKEIASSLRIGEKTVKSHVSSLLAKLGLQSRTKAALYAIRLGLVSPQTGTPYAI